MNMKNYLRLAKNLLDLGEILYANGQSARSYVLGNLFSDLTFVPKFRLYKFYVPRLHVIEYWMLDDKISQIFTGDCLNTN